jgi:protein-tyrosine phosphatase
MAEAILKKKFLENNIKGIVDSAGFESFNINEPPDARVVNTAAEHGILVDGRARIFVKDDFKIYDKIYVMDTQNYWDVMELTRNDDDKAKVEYLLNLLEPGLNKTVPNPYNSGLSDCKQIFRMLNKAADKIVELAKVEEEKKAVANN